MALGSYKYFLHLTKFGHYNMYRAYGTRIIHTLFIPSQWAMSLS